MFEHVLSRRSFVAMAGLGAAGLARACDATPPPTRSPFLVGPYPTGTTILREHSVVGEVPLAIGMPQFMSSRDLPIPPSKYNATCRDGRVVYADIPQRIAAAVYYPTTERKDRVVPISQGPFPVLLYAHAVRYLESVCQSPLPMHEDYTRAEVMLRHVASYGCVAVAPDLSWLPPSLSDSVTLEQAFDLRAQVLLGYYRYLLALNATVFAGQLDLNRVILVGHSTGAGACMLAGPQLASIVNLKSLAYGLLGPYFAYRSPVPVVSSAIRNLLVVHGTLDAISGGDAVAGYTAAGAPKTLVTIPGANHFGYTHLCELDNDCTAAYDKTGTISRIGQQMTAASYLVALLRYYALRDEAAGFYLNGQQQVQGLEIQGVTGIEVQQSGINPKPVVK